MKKIKEDGLWYLFEVINALILYRDGARKIAPKKLEDSKYSLY